MSTETQTSTGIGTATGDASWKGGVVAGLAGTFVMAGLMSVMNPTVLEVPIPALYGLAPPESPAAGWFIHMSHGAVFGVIFAAFTHVSALSDLGENVGKSVGAGLGWGVATWVFGAALLMPLWLSAVGFPNAPPFPNFAVPSLLWHLVFGGVLGAVYPFVSDL